VLSLRLPCGARGETTPSLLSHAPAPSDLHRAWLQPWCPGACQPQRPRQPRVADTLAPLGPAPEPSLQKHPHVFLRPRRKLGTPVTTHGPVGRPYASERCI